MTGLEWIAAIALSVTGLVWLAIAFGGTLGVLLTRPLTNQEPCEDPIEVAVVIAARDEEARIAQTLDHLLATVGPRISITVVDDRSTDATASIVQSKAESDPRLRLVRVQDLPEGWLGKPHALYRGSADVDAPWILFTDADTWIAPDAIARAIGAAERSRRPIDHVAVLPGYEAGGVWGVGATLALYIHFLARCGVTNAGSSLLPVGVGAFNLIRTDAYRAIGGHEPLRFEVVDDVKLALLINRTGRPRGRGHSLILSGPDSVRIDWKAEISTLVSLIQKNFFAMARFSLPLACLYIVAGLLAQVIAVCALIVGLLPVDIDPAVRAPALFTGAAWLATALPLMFVARQFKWPVRGGLLAPLMAWIAPYALWRSVRQVIRDGGVTWRGRVYSLAELRSRQVW